MGGGKKAVSFFIGRDGLAVTGIAFLEQPTFFPPGAPFIAVNGWTPGNHVDGIVVEKLQLGSKLQNVISGAGSGG